MSGQIKEVLVDANLAAALVGLWGDSGPPVSTLGPIAAENIERRYQLRLPEGFRDYLVEAAPNNDWMDDGGITWWSPTRIKTLIEECGAETPKGQLESVIEVERHLYLVFADFLDWCYAYAICCSDGPNRGKVALIGGAPDRFVAASFSSFVKLAAEDSVRLHSPAGDRFDDLI